VQKKSEKLPNKGRCVAALIFSYLCTPSNRKRNKNKTLKVRISQWAIEFLKPQIYPKKCSLRQKCSLNWYATKTTHVHLRLLLIATLSLSSENCSKTSANYLFQEPISD
jgi:hypothetical protein